jgi:hypothetical protein
VGQGSVSRRVLKFRVVRAKISEKL